MEPLTNMQSVESAKHTSVQDDGDQANNVLNQGNSTASSAAAAADGHTVASNNSDHQQCHPGRDNGEIWSMRVQQELLTLTTTKDETNTTDDLSSSSAMLPHFVSIPDYTLNIENGTCFVTVAIQVSNNNTTLATTRKQDKKENETSTLAATTETVVVIMDLSLRETSTTSATPSFSYPFVSPLARLHSGHEFFPSQSTATLGSYISMDDLDWTPSLHLTDVILHIALKIRESILQGEPIHATENDEFDETDPIDKVVGEVVDEVKRGARRLASKLGSLGKASFLSPPASTSAMTATSDNIKSTPSPRQRTVRGLLSGRSKNAASSPEDGNNKNDRGSSAVVKIGMEINLLEEPWVASHGVYSCKAIRRPPFVDQVMAAATAANSNSKDGPQQQPSFSSPTSMFRSLAQSARSVMEESFLMITDTQIVELRASKLNMQMGTVTFCISIEFMSKLKFRRHESLSLFFKTAPEDPLIYMCPDSGDAVHQIQSVLKQKGVRGKHTNAAAYRAIHEALEMVKVIQAKEAGIDYKPSVEGVNEIMDLYRQAAEKFESAGDVRHEEVVTHMRKFLAKASTIGILDGSLLLSNKDLEKPLPSPLPTGSTLHPLSPPNDDATGTIESPTALNPMSPSSITSSQAASSDTNMMNDLSDLNNDVEKYHLNDDDDEDEDAPIRENTSSEDFGINDIDDMAADLDAMMREADKELAELMSS